MKKIKITNTILISILLISILAFTFYITLFFDPIVNVINSYNFVKCPGSSVCNIPIIKHLASKPLYIIFFVGIFVLIYKSLEKFVFDIDKKYFEEK